MYLMMNEEKNNNVHINETLLIILMKKYFDNVKSRLFTLKIETLYWKIRFDLILFHSQCNQDMEVIEKRLKKIIQNHTVRWCSSVFVLMNSITVSDC